jgi:hypothetical protein
MEAPVNSSGPAESSREISEELRLGWKPVVSLIEWMGKPIHLLIADVMMPELDGPSLAARGASAGCQVVAEASVVGA